MPATAARIAFITREYRLSTAGPDAGVDSTFGSLARDSDPEKPFDSYFDSSLDADNMANQRLTLLGAQRRRFRATLASASPALALAYQEKTPVAQVIHPDRNADLNCAVAEISINLLGNRAALTLWG